MADVPTAQIISDWGIATITAVGGIVGGIGTFMFKHLKAENQQLRSEMDKCKKTFADELKEVKSDLTALVLNSNAEVLAAIEKANSGSVTIRTCTSKHEKLVLISEHKQELNTNEHNDLKVGQGKQEEALLTVLATVTQMAQCLHDIQNDIKCEDSK